MECKQTVNKQNCTCTFSYSRKGVCCDCIDHHKSKGQLPGCYFPEDHESTGDRSVESFVRLVQERGNYLY